MDDEIKSEGYEGQPPEMPDDAKALEVAPQVEALENTPAEDEPALQIDMDEAATIDDALSALEPLPAASSEPELLSGAETLDPDQDAIAIDPAPAVQAQNPGEAAPMHAEDAASIAASTAEDVASAAKQKKTGSGIALPTFADSENSVVGNKTGIPLPAQQATDDAVAPEPEPAQFATQPSAQIAAAPAEGKREEDAAPQESAVAALPEEDHAAEELTDAGAPELMAARVLGAAITDSIMFTYSPLAELASCPHLYAALLSVKGNWNSSVSMDDLIIAAARSDSDSVDEAKSWYVLRVRKLIINVLDFVWITQAYHPHGDEIIPIANEQLFTELTGVSSSDFNELCHRGFIHKDNFTSLVHQFHHWEQGTLSPAKYIFTMLAQERMVA